MFKRVRQFFCNHDWSCGWSRKCTGDHHCLRCDKGRS